ncbi:ScbR family autoregulator-binding transcription factor [Streptomyces antimicrobicus]|uniref:TetR/AcrR family transcriptional regulator n=1 Tax=Streptomyces antimicrobicus TaxID=2883108 RepID=A0ABS8B1V6_9ACTN|nr:ScbR family autoregulator-binding transcription factor [Streptomyces antimicrobicus]MCB5178594.1 TetR/AcrR family transcriptional regulator [Streptomyces antimicrobicus]
MARARQERAEITRQAILDGAAIAFDRSGFGGTSLSDVVKHAGVTKGALYFHFPSKEALARTLMDEQLLVADLVPTDDPGLQTVIDLTHHMAHGLRTNVRIRAGIRLVIEFGSFTHPDPSAYEGWIDIGHSCLTPAQERGDLHASLDVHALSTYLVGSFTGVQVTSHVRTGRADLHDRIVDLWNLVLPGIVPADRIDRFDPAGSPECRAARAAQADPELTARNRQAVPAG